MMTVMLNKLDDLVNEVRLSYHAFTEFARRANGDRIDPSGRAVLEYLSKNPPSTVPTMARSRGVTRQHIQTIVSDLEIDGLIEPSINPAHKRSPLFALTEDGRELIESVVQTEQDILRPLGDVIDPGQLVTATQTLAEVRRLLTQMETGRD
jgi:DNA-binding MarR family transcriptional regulator